MASWSAWDDSFDAANLGHHGTLNESGERFGHSRGNQLRSSATVANGPERGAGGGSPCSSRRLLQSRLKLLIEFSRDFVDLAVIELSENSSWPVIFESGATFGTFAQ
jgi:hypothetical protein